MILVYFGADHLLSSHLKSATSSNTNDQKVIVQDMAKFLETNPTLQKEIQKSGQYPTSDEVDLSKVARYFGTSPTDQYFKNYLIQKKKMHLDDADEQTKLFIGMSDYIRQNPKDAVDSLEGALVSIPMDLKAERDAIKPAFIHSSINFIEEFITDEKTKKIYLKRFIHHTQDPEIKNALESHFPDLKD